MIFNFYRLKGMRRRYTREGMHTGLFRAPHVRVSSKSELARALRRVVNHTAFGIGAARARAWVDALLVAAGLVESAVGVRNTFGPASVERVTEVARQTGAHRHTLSLRALGVVATR